MSDLLASVHRHRQAILALVMIAVVAALLWTARGALPAFFIGLALVFILAVWGAGMALMQAGAQMVKLEGGGWTAETTRFLVERGVPVCAHLGLTPQSVHALGGYRIQGRGEDAVASEGSREPRHPHPAQVALPDRIIKMENAPQLIDLPAVTDDHRLLGPLGALSGGNVRG